MIIQLILIGLDIAIPTIIISKQNGEALMNALQRNNPEEENIKVSVKFPSVRSFLYQLSHFSIETII